MMDTHFHSPKILLVDDRSENILALTATLSGEGYDLHKASSGKEAFEKTILHEFAAILMDVQMPEMNGFETARLIRTLNHAKSTPIIFVTAIHQTEAHAHLGYEVGAIDYLFKPIDTGILKAKLSILVQLYKRNYELQFYNQKRQDEAVRDAENKLLKNQVLARDEFLAMASHELKTPITPLNLQMQSFLKMVRNRTLKQMDDERLERMLSTAYSQVERLAKTIDKLLDVSRFTAGKVAMNFEKVNLSELVKRTIHSFEIQLNKIGCAYQITAPDQVPIVCDLFRIEQVLINLLSNAMKYGPGKPIEIQVTSCAEWAEIRIKDHGIGIAKKDHQRVFQRFERATPPTNYGGLGLGLYITCKIIKQHQGSIHIESQLGQGATFIVRIPSHLSPQMLQVPI
jgi:signal transduction histidine kinase